MVAKWDTPEELTTDAAAFTKLMHCLAGLYFWEFFTSLDFEWSFVTGKRKFQWPLIFYMAGRYCLFFALIGILIALDATTELNCQALYTFNQLAGDAAVGLASINLSIRTMAVWSQKLYIVIPLIIVILGHWSLILQGVLLKAEWIPGQGCAITQTHNVTLAATFIYSMSFDALVMILSIIKLWGRHKRSQLVGMLFRDGLIYFFIAFAANLCATIFMLLNLNSIMSIIFNVPAAIASTIVACRAVRRLTKFKSSGPEIYTASSHSGVVGFRSMNNELTSHVGRPKSSHNKDLGTGVHVQMQTFTVGDDVVPLPHYVADGEHKRVQDIETGSETDVGSPMSEYKTEAL